MCKRVCDWIQSGVEERWHETGRPLQLTSSRCDGMPAYLDVILRTNRLPHSYKPTETHISGKLKRLRTTHSLLISSLNIVMQFTLAQLLASTLLLSKLSYAQCDIGEVTTEVRLAQRCNCSH